MTMDVPLLQCGRCERLKLGVHAGALGLAAVCGVYNAAAWLSRREAHLAVNAILYVVLAAWEQQHVSHHLAEMRRPAEPLGSATAGDGDAPLTVEAAA